MPSFDKGIGLQDRHNLLPDAAIYKRVAEHLGHRDRKLLQYLERIWYLPDVVYGFWKQG